MYSWERGKMQMWLLSRSSTLYYFVLRGSVTSVKHKKVLKFETPIVQNGWTLLQCFTSWSTFFVVFFSPQANTTALSLQFHFPCPQCCCIQFLLQRDLAISQFLWSLVEMKEWSLHCLGVFWVRGDPAEHIMKLSQWGKSSELIERDLLRALSKHGISFAGL